MYAEKRLALDDNGIFIRSRATHMLLESKNNIGECKDLKGKEVKQIREGYIEQFPNSVIDIRGYSGINQGEEGACSFVAFLNMRKLNGLLPVPKEWKELWNEMTGKNCDMLDIADMLDSVSTALKDPKWLENLVYFPVRSRNNGENKYNPELTMTSVKYEKVIEAIEKKIQGLIDTGIPIEVNMGEHSRVAVAYNDENILFADSWGNKYSQCSKDGLDNNAAGFSVVNKRLIYEYVRDIAYYAKSGPEEKVPDLINLRF